jgi:Fe-S-cluster-containing hydrogenase component 2
MADQIASACLRANETDSTHAIGCTAAATHMMMRQVALLLAWAKWSMCAQCADAGGAGTCIVNAISMAC